MTGNVCRQGPTSVYNIFNFKSSELKILQTQILMIKTHVYILQKVLQKNEGKLSCVISMTLYCSHYAMFAKCKHCLSSDKKQDNKSFSFSGAILRSFFQSELHLLYFHKNTSKDLFLLPNHATSGNLGDNLYCYQEIHNLVSTRQKSHKISSGLRMRTA